MQADGFDEADAASWRLIVLDQTVFKSTALIRLLDYLGGLRALLGQGLRLIPATMRDWLYDGLARVRRGLAPAPLPATVAGAVGGGFVLAQKRLGGMPPTTGAEDR